MGRYGMSFVYVFSGSFDFVERQGKKEGQFLLGMAPHLLAAGKVRKEGYEERSLSSLFL
jgi:hypothetical protein